ncbi:20363_t:CDS:2 [Rhizophagus irregularis]|nr:20363_t:CDS:2 [Rhizophagus irregularis]
MKNKKNLSQTAAAIRQRKRRAAESLDERETHLTKDRENKRIKRSLETSNQREARLNRNRAQKQHERQRRVLENADERLNRQDDERHTDTIIQPLSESDCELLQKFRDKMNKLEHKICPVYNERFPSINLILGMCRRCYGNKNEIKKFSRANNMDPGDVPEELKNLTKIEEMLIAGNVINFPQDIGEFVFRLPRHPSTLDTLIVCRSSAESSTSFRDFTVRRDKVRKALCWLKRNNQYYADIIIDDNVLRTLPDEGSIDDLLPQVRDAENRLHHIDYEPRDADHLDELYFSPFPLRNENHVIDDALARMQSETGPVMWPNIDDTAINEFNTPGYIACAFPTLYPTGSADLQAEHDYIELVNKLQKHTRCSPSNCLKTKNSQQYCRFGFPKDNVEHNFIHENDHVAIPT